MCLLTFTCVLMFAHTHKQTHTHTHTHTHARTHARTHAHREWQIAGNDSTARSDFMILGHEIRVLQGGRIHSVALNAVRHDNLGLPDRVSELASAHQGHTGPQQANLFTHPETSSFRTPRLRSSRRSPSTAPGARVHVITRSQWSVRHTNHSGLAVRTDADAPATTSRANIACSAQHTFSKVSALVYSLYKSTRESTFENLCLQRAPRHPQHARRRHPHRRTAQHSNLSETLNRQRPADVLPACVRDSHSS